MNLPATIKAFLDAIEGDEKFVLVLGAGIVDTLLLMGGWLDQNNYVVLTLATVGAYITGKVIEDRGKNGSAA
jgi:hypothetical protein